MRASIIFSTIFTTAALAAPILDGTLDAATGKVTSLADNLEATITDAASDIVKRDLTDMLENSGDLSDLTDLITRQDEDIVDDVPAGDLSRRLLGLDDLLNKVFGLLGQVTGIAGGLESTLNDLIEHADGADVEGILMDVEGQADELLAKVQDVSDDAGLGLDLAAINPALGVISNEVTVVLQLVQSLVDVGVVHDLTGEISGVLEDVLRLVDNLLSVETLVGSD
ncbi:hypothetical protein PMZ80_010353 [Knufia obscura]|uniref:Uncharacterized protein n=1 Tax=Knufia obscura TaxID=1635080 RepID=A0ABR0R9M6_9EURO|nr:hypothetical protein PMZ80_010353 [Knufia obscura]